MEWNSLTGRWLCRGNDIKEAAKSLKIGSKVIFECKGSNIICYNVAGKEVSLIAREIAWVFAPVMYFLEKSCSGSVSGSVSEYCYDLPAAFLILNVSFQFHPPSVSNYTSRISDTSSDASPLTRELEISQLDPLHNLLSNDASIASVNESPYLTTIDIMNGKRIQPAEGSETETSCSSVADICNATPFLLETNDNGMPSLTIYEREPPAADTLPTRTPLISNEDGNSPSAVSGRQQMNQIVAIPTRKPLTMAPNQSSPSSEAPLIDPPGSPVAEIPTTNQTLDSNKEKVQRIEVCERELPSPAADIPTASIQNSPSSEAPLIDPPGSPVAEIPATNQTLDSNEVCERESPSPAADIPTASIQSSPSSEAPLIDPPGSPVAEIPAEITQTMYSDVERFLAFEFYENEPPISPDANIAIRPTQDSPCSASPFKEPLSSSTVNFSIRKPLTMAAPSPNDDGTIPSEICERELSSSRNIGVPTTTPILNESRIPTSAVCERELPSPPAADNTTRIPLVMEPNEDRIPHSSTRLRESPPSSDVEFLYTTTPKRKNKNCYNFRSRKKGARNNSFISSSDSDDYSECEQESIRRPSKNASKLKEFSTMVTRTKNKINYAESKLDESNDPPFKCESDSESYMETPIDIETENEDELKSLSSEYSLSSNERGCTKIRNNKRRNRSPKKPHSKRKRGRGRPPKKIRVEKDYRSPLTKTSLDDKSSPDSFESSNDEIEVFINV